MGLLACSAPKNGALPAASANSVVAYTPETVIAALKAAGIPIEAEIVYTATTDPNSLLGRPNQYIGKAAWRDARITAEGDPDSAGGTVEIFASTGDRQRRQDYVAEIAKTPIFAEYAYANGMVLVRVSHKLLPTDADGYARAVAAL